jgi:regulator of protease activity HflC (stomatin/prohibitin superfamily)
VRSDSPSDWETELSKGQTMKSVLKAVGVAAVGLGWVLLLNLALRMFSAADDWAAAFGFVMLIGVFAGGVLLLVHGLIHLQRKHRAAFERWGFPMAVLLAAVWTTGCGTTVNPGYVGIQVDYYGKDKGVQSYPVVTGRVWYNPITTAVLEYPTFVQTAKWTRSLNEGAPVNEEITFTNADGMSVAADISVSYHLEMEKVPAFYVRFRSDDLNVFTHGFLRNLARDKFDSHGGRFRIDQIMGDNAQFVRDVRADLQTELDAIGVRIDQFGFIGAPRPPQQVIEAINAKVHANQLALQKQNELVQVQADAAKQVANAEGYAKSLLVKGEAEATYNKKLADSMSERLIEKWKLDKWNGVLPTVTGGAMPILNVK